MKSRLAWLATFAVLLAGCGGDGTGPSTRGSVHGIVTTESGQSVRDALVYLTDDPSGHSVQSNSNGVYEITDVPTGDRRIRVEVTQDGVKYLGSNVARILVGEPTENLNIAVYRQNQLASIHGQVKDRFGNLIEGARVFLNQHEGGALSSSYAITNRDGNYSMDTLKAGLSYDVQVNALDFDSNFNTITLNTGEDRRLDFNLADGERVTLPPPAVSRAVGWTSPPVTRTEGSRDYLDVAKHLAMPTYQPSSAAQSRVASGGTVVEADIVWGQVKDSALLGYGIYRKDPGAALRVLYFLRDPLADFYADMDNLSVGSRYSYNVTSLSVKEQEGDFSATVSTTPIGEQTLRAPINGANPTFKWNTASGANNYTVYLFDRYPHLNTAPIFTAGPTSGTEVTYSGATLASGTYYYFVIGNSPDAFTISPVGTVRVP